MDVGDGSRKIGPATRETVRESCKAACGWEIATWAYLLISFVQVSTLLRTYSSVKDLEPMAAPRCRFPWSVICTSVSVNSCLALVSCSCFTTR